MHRGLSYTPVTSEVPRPHDVNNKTKVKAGNGIITKKKKGGSQAPIKAVMIIRCRPSQI